MNGDSSDEEIQLVLSVRRNKVVHNECEILLIANAMNSTNQTLSTFGGSSQGKDRNEDRHPDKTAVEILDLFFRNPTIKSDLNFRRIYRVPRTVYEVVTKAIQGYDKYFRLSCDATGRRGIPPVNKFAAAFTMLAYGSAAHANERYLKLSETTALVCLKRFCSAMVAIFKDKYIRYPTTSEAQKLSDSYSSRGFPGCIGSIDCAGWVWRNCPMSMAGSHTGRNGKPVIRMEAICGADFRIWHLYFGSPGAMNDVNILNCSPFVSDVISGDFKPCIEYQLAGEDRNDFYLLADGIYPQWPMFAGTIKVPKSTQERAYGARQESARKDIERLFGVVMARFHIIKRPCRLWYKEHISDVMYTCFILHNMVVDFNASIGMDDYDALDEDMPYVEHCALLSNAELEQSNNHIQAESNDTCFNRIIDSALGVFDKDLYWERMEKLINLY